MKKILSIFNSNSQVMSQLRAVALGATALTAALMQLPILAHNVDVLRGLIYVQGAVALITKFTSVGDTPPPA